MPTIKGSFIILVVLAMVLLVIGSAFPNGINPPRPAKSILVNAVCKHKTNNDEAEVFRAKVKYSDKTNKILELIVEGETEEIEITDISSINSISNSVDSDGFTKATIIRSGYTEKEKVRLKVSANGSKVALVGFDKDGNKESVNISDCKSVSFSSNNTSKHEEHRPVMKK
ncbi:MAG: hypothetical protein PHI31_03340 [Desulfuromonadaceae bacterium]|nr:hypothetical protein [Desulfuromonadaceae bacterium]